MLGESYKKLYDDYYSEGVDVKRELTAAESLEHIEALVGNRRFSSIVDFGAGQGALVDLLSKSKRADAITALEISESGVRRISERHAANVTSLIFDGYHTPFPDKHFELGLSIHVLEHVEHERMYLSELKRICRQAIIEVPLELNGNLHSNIAAMAPYGHINFYQRQTFENLLTTTGFKINALAVNTVTMDMDVHMSGPVVGRAKNVIRRSALRLSETLATRRFVYLCTAYVDCG